MEKDSKSDEEGGITDTGPVIDSMSGNSKLHKIPSQMEKDSKSEEEEEVEGGDLEEGGDSNDDSIEGEKDEEGGEINETGDIDLYSIFDYGEGCWCCSCGSKEGGVENVDAVIDFMIGNFKG